MTTDNNDYQSTPNYAQLRQQIQNKVDFRDASLAGINSIKDDKVFQHMNHPQFQRDGQQVSKYLEQAGDRIAGQSNLSKLKTWFLETKAKLVNKMPSKGLLNDVADTDVVGLKKVKSTAEGLSINAVMFNIKSHQAKLDSKQNIAEKLLLHNPDMLKPSNDERNNLIRRKESLCNELKVNFEHHYGYQKDKPFTYLDDPLVKVVDDAYNNHQTLNTASFAFAKFILKDQSKNNYDVNLQQEWNMQHGVYVKDSPNITIKQYLGVSTCLSKRRQAPTPQLNKRPIENYQHSNQKPNVKHNVQFRNTQKPNKTKIGHNINQQGINR